MVDGSVTADRYIMDKLQTKVIQMTIGEKGTEKRLRFQGAAAPNDSGGTVIVKNIPKTDPRRTQSSLAPDQIHQLTKLICVVEQEYGMPMDIEWAFIKQQDNKGNTNNDAENDNASGSSDRYVFFVFSVCIYCSID